jgi:galacturan 1,4-alpha-galacturonidase
MKSFPLLLALAAPLIYASAIAVDHDALRSSVSVPRSDISPAALPSRSNYRQKDNWGNAIEKDRKKITIRASKDDHDDVSDDFLLAIKKANNGGLVHLKKGHKYVIGKKLDLTFLKDVYVKIDGELKVSSRNFGKIIMSLKRYSSPTISSTGKPTTSTMTSRRVLPFGFGAESKSILQYIKNLQY